MIYTAFRKGAFLDREEATVEDMEQQSDDMAIETPS
jgi:hypothetical protein